MNSEKTEPPEFSFIVTFLNEQGNVKNSIESLVNALRGWTFRYEIVCVDNGSTDQTYREIIEEQKVLPQIRIVTVPLNFGYGAGLLLGFVSARGRNVGYIWGDHQIPEETIRICIQTFLKNPGTVVKGVRASRGESLWRRFVSGVYNRIVRVLFGVRVMDTNSAPKIFPFNPLEKLNIRSTDWFIDPEVIIQLHRKKIPVIEIPFIPLKRLKGVSKVTWATILQFLANIISYKVGGTPLRPIYSVSFTTRQEQSNKT